METVEKNFIEAVLTLFKAVPVMRNENVFDFKFDNEKNLKYGFFITDDAFKNCPCVGDKVILDFIKNQFGYDILELNRGFYKSFGTVKNLTPQQILANKILHYMTTYGFERLGIFDRDLVYIPADKLELPENSKPVKITVINSIDNDEIKNRLVKIIESGAALSKDTLENIFTIVKFLKIRLNLDEIANKEFKILACDNLNLLPSNAVEFLRYMVYKATNSTLLIKNPVTILTIKTSGKNFDGYFRKYINENGMAKLAEIFHRYKPLWLAFKPHSKFMKSTINKMRKFADTYHRPVQPKLLETLTTAQDIDMEKLKIELAKVTTYRKISIANAILYRLNAPKNILYKIRNGKVFVENFSGNFLPDEKILAAVIDSIVEDIKPNVSGKKIYIPENFNYAIPVSEKKFIGAIPEGSSYTFNKKSVVVGVHWFNVMNGSREERVDLDLHLNSNDRDIGWQNDFYYKNYVDTKNCEVIFSGDMADAPINKGGATEAFLVGESLTDEFMMVNLNNYNKFCDVPFKIVLADVEQGQIDRQYLIDSHETAFCIPNEIVGGEMFLGFLDSDSNGNKKFYFSVGDMGDRRVARSDKQSDKIISATRAGLKSCLSMKKVLEKAGAIFTDSNDCDINLDPTVVTKDILLNIFAK